MDADALIAARFAAEAAVILVLTIVSLWCLWGFMQAVLGEEPGRVQVGWWLGFFASRLAFASIAGMLRSARP